MHHPYIICIKISPVTASLIPYAQASVRLWKAQMFFRLNDNAMTEILLPQIEYYLLYFLIKAKIILPFENHAIIWFITST